MSINIIQEKIKTKRKSMDHDSSRSSVSGDAELDVNIVKHVLEICSNDATIIRLIRNIRNISYYTLKEYLFYLITCDLISYNGEKKVYAIKYEGWKLLLMIKSAKHIIDTGNRNIVIYH
jgi:predicted transcriptional regulator